MIKTKPNLNGPSMNWQMLREVRFGFFYGYVLDV